MDKISQLKQWMKDEICRYGQFAKIVQILEDEGGSEAGVGKHGESKFKCNIFTEEYRYRISAIDRSEDEGYLGCTSSTRKPRAGEDWTRGNDLPDGKFTRETWEHIKNGILKYELVELAPKIEGIADEKREAVADEEKAEAKESEVKK